MLQNVIHRRRDLSRGFKIATGTRFNLNKANIIGMTQTSQKLQAVFASRFLRNVNKSQSTRCCSIL